MLNVYNFFNSFNSITSWYIENLLAIYLLFMLKKMTMLKKAVTVDILNSMTYASITAILETIYLPHPTFCPTLC